MPIEAKEEREAVIRWLRDRVDFFKRRSKESKRSEVKEKYILLAMTTRGAADSIERGDHLMKGQDHG